MDIILKLISLFFSVGILWIAYLIRRVSGRWQTPAGIWCVGWFLLTFIPLVAVPTVPSNPLAILYIFVASIAFSLPVIGIKWSRIYVATGSHLSSVFDTLFLRSVFYVFAFVTLVSLAINLSIQGVTLSGLTSNFFETSSSLISDRYNQTTIENVFAQISNVFTYVTVSLGGLIFSGHRTLTGKSRVLLVSMTPALVLMTVAGAKGTIFLCVALFYAGIIIRRIRKGDERIFDLKSLLRISVMLLLLVPFVVISFLSRGLFNDSGLSDLQAQLYRSFISYSSAHVYAFSDWFSWYIGQHSSINYSREEVTGGFYTFMSIFKALGSTKVVPVGFFDEYFQYSWFLQTNIYTIFRGLITDFTLLGSIVFMYVLGFACNLIFVGMLKNEKAAWSIAFYIVFCGFVYTSFLISILVWSSMYPTFVIVAVLLVINNERSLSMRSTLSHSI